MVYLHNMFEEMHLRQLMKIKNISGSQNVEKMSDKN